MAKSKIDKLQQLADEKASFIDDQLEKFEKLLDKLGPLLNERIVEEFLKSLSVENGVIASDAQNLRKTALIDKAFDAFQSKDGYKVITQMIDDFSGIGNMNLEYFSLLNGTPVNGDSIKKVVYERLGLNEKGELKKDGFMKRLIDNFTPKDGIKDFVLDKIIGGSGFEDLKKGLREMVVGNPETAGTFKQHYRNMAYDTYAKIDAMNGKLYADKLKLKYFIYAGTRRKASRLFCIKKKGKVFSVEEAEKWKDEIGKTGTDDKGNRVQAGPIVTGEDIITYNPLIDRGGYGCVDDIMYISEEIAFIKRPDLKPKE